MNNQEETKIKKTWGGKRPNSGRPRKMQEDEIIAKLQPFETLAFEKLRDKIESGDIKALQIYFSYYLGQPVQKVDSRIEGNLTNIAVEVVRPQLVDSQEN